MKNSCSKRSLSFIMMVIIMLSMIIPFTASAEGISPISLNGINSDRKTNYLIAYTDDYGSRTGTDEKGIEAIINSNGVVTVVGGNNNEIPKGGFVLSGSSTKKTYIEKNIKIGSLIYLDKEAKSVLVIPKDYSPFYSTTIDFNAVNAVRSESTIIIYDGSDGRSTTGTNQWGYEVVVNKDGFIISLDSNNNPIPEGGLVLSAVGTEKKAILREASKLGMSVKVNYTEKKITISYSKENAIESPSLILAGFKEKLAQSKTLYKNLDYKQIDSTLASLESTLTTIKTAINADDILGYTVAQNQFDKTAKIIKGLLVETPAVEGRALWIRPKQTSLPAVKKVVKEVYDLGFNVICIEALYDNTLIVQPPEGSPFSKNPIYGEFDVLKAYIDEAHRYGMEVHLWMPVYRVAHGSSTHPSLGLNVKKPEWLNISNQGLNYTENNYGKGYFLNPALPEVTECLLSVYDKILKNYNIDGFQLDYIRYPDMVNNIDFGYDDYTCKLYKDKTGIDPKTISYGDSNWSDWCKFRAQFVTDFVLEVKKMVNESRPDIYLSCDVAPGYDESLNRKNQDTKTWLTEAIVDIIYPMCYGPLDRVKTWTDETITLSGDKVFTYIGIGDTGTTGSEVAFSQIELIRESGADGFAFFSYDQYVGSDYTFISDTLLSKNVVPPTFNSKKALIAQLNFIKTRIKDVIAPAKVNGSDELTALCSQIDSLLQKLDSSTITGCKDDISKLVSDIEKITFEKVTDNTVKAVITSDLRVVKKITTLSKDDAKAEYYKKHPLPDMYELPDENPNAGVSGATSEGTGDEGKTGSAETIAQIAMMVILIISALGLPLYFILESRRRRLLDEYNEKNLKNEKNEKTDNKTKTEDSDQIPEDSDTSDKENKE